MATDDLQGFSKRMQKRADKLPGGVNRAKRRVALAVDQALVLATPVDTGRARANWFASLDTPLDADETFRPKDTSGQGALNQGAGVIGRVKPGQVIFFTNNLPYIVPLNQGSSAQAPAGFVEEAVAAGVREARKVKVLDKK